MWVGWVDLQTGATTMAAGVHNIEGGCWFVVGKVA